MPKSVRNLTKYAVRTGQFKLRHMTAPVRLLPDFIILGAQRAGTTSLYEYIVDHPQVGAASKKEVHFFDRHYTEGVNWYRAHFPPAVRRQRFENRTGKRFLTGEASPYYLAHPMVPERIAAVAPDARFLILLRNPIDRALSHYYHNRR